MKELDNDRAEQKKNMEREEKAFAIRSHVHRNEKKYTSTDLRDLIAWKTGKPCPSQISSVGARRTYWNEIKGKPCEWKHWTEVDEERREQLLQKGTTVYQRHYRSARERGSISDIPCYARQ